MIFTNWIKSSPNVKSRAKRRILNYLRGYHILKKTNQLDKITVIRNDLGHTPLSIKAGNRSRDLFGVGDNVEIIIRQFILTSMEFELNKALLFSIGSTKKTISYGLPEEWQNVVRSHGFEVNSKRSTFLWYSNVFYFFLKGIYRILEICWESIFEIIGPSNIENGSYTFFCDLSPKNLPVKCQDGKSYDIITWYQNWDKRPSSITKIVHDVKSASDILSLGMPIIKSRHRIPPLRNFKTIVNFFCISIRLIFFAFFALFRKSYWQALMLPEAILAAKMKVQATERIAKEYMIHCSSFLYRPLWTYEAEKKGSKILFYFYSTNHESFKQPNQYPFQDHNWHLITWSNYLVWDSYQANFIERAIGPNKKTHIVGPINFTDSNLECDLPSSEFIISVFDVQPQRDSAYQMLGIPIEYYIPEVSISFFSDIDSILQAKGIKMVLKRKRNIGKLVHHLYSTFLNELSKKGNLIEIDPDVAAQRVIEKSDLVISMPFTSTAIIARGMGKPSIYYDSTGKVQKDDRAAHGIPVIIGHAELDKWVSSVLIEKQRNDTTMDKQPLAAKGAVLTHYSERITNRRKDSL